MLDTCVLGTSPFLRSKAYDTSDTMRYSDVRLPAVRVLYPVRLLMLSLSKTHASSQELHSTRSAYFCISALDSRPVGNPSGIVRLIGFPQARWKRSRYPEDFRSVLSANDRL